MTRRVAAAVLTPPVWIPPGQDPRAWRVALAEDLLDVLALMAEVEPAVVVPAADLWLRSEVGWPGLPWYAAQSARLPDLVRAVAAAPAPALGASPDQVALIAGDAPDLPGLVIAKLLRPLTTRPVAVAPAVDGAGLLGFASRLPAPEWLPDAGLDDLDILAVRRAAPQLTDVVSTAGWHRLRRPEVLAGLDPRLEGWDATRALLEA
ncbi:hypothetical protein [Luedemannella helvata]|uniref:DUF2064 domain-containing protein n=1 Tax=Luedemannella helvata TaxID=349315 RepID=A0ABP4XCE4_9ACTN